MSLTVLVDDDTVSPSPAIRVTVTSSPSITAPLSIVRIHPDGRQYRLIVEDAPQLIGGGWVGVDRHAPFDRTVTYRASAAGQTGTSEDWWLAPAGTWLVSADNPDASVRVDAVIYFGDRERTGTSQRMDILNSEAPVHVVDSPLHLETGSMRLWVGSADMLAELDALLRPQRPVLLNTHYSPLSPTWLWIQTGWLLTNPGTVDQVPGRFMDLTFEGTSQPDVDAVPVFTDNDLNALWPTSNAAEAAYATDLDMQADNRV